MAKIGFEVEGRLKGILTLLVDFDELLSKGVNFILGEASHHKVSHILVGAHDKEANEITSILRLLSDSQYLVTLECKKLPDVLLPRVNYVLVIDNPDIWRMLGTDQIKFVDHALNVKMVALENMTSTHPSDFDADESLYW